MPTANFLDSLFSLSGQTAVVVGGTGVLGGALCEGLAQAGAFVVVSGRGDDRGDQRVQTIRSLGGEAEFIPVEAADRTSMRALLDRSLALRGSVDILVNCAGTNAANPYFEARDEDWQTVLDTNLTATHLGCQIFGQQMASGGRGGAILNIGSVTADKPLSRVFAYSCSKAAVVNLTQNVARELAPLGVRVNCLCPGFFPAEQNRKILDPERTRRILEQTPMARFGQPHELVGAALLLLSNAGSFITGASYYVDGGFTAMRF